MTVWMFGSLPRDAIAGGLWALALSFPDFVGNWILFVQMAAVSFANLCVMRLTHFVVVFLVPGGVIRPLHGSLLAVVVGVFWGLFGLVSHLQFGDDEGYFVINEILWCVFPPALVSTAWDWIRERRVGNPLS